MEDLGSLVEQAREHANNFKHDEALQLARKAIKIAPRDPASLLAMVHVWYQAKRLPPLEKAVAAALEVVTDPVERARCHAKMSLIYSTYTGPTWWWVKAVEHAQAAVAAAPELAASHIALAYALERHYRMATAVAAIECAYSLEPTDKLAQDGVKMRGRLATLDGQIAEAHAKLALEPTGEHQRQLGDMLGYRDAYDEAIAAYDHALEIDPRDKAAAKARIALLIRAGRLEPAPKAAKPRAARAKAAKPKTAKSKSKAAKPKTAKQPKATKTKSTRATATKPIKSKRKK